MLTYLNSLAELAFITNLRGSQLLIVIVVILLLFGTRRLPDLARGFGKAIREFRKAASGIEKDFRESMDDKPTPPPSANQTAATPPQEDEKKVV
jgi:sec-independent protein translocase protein TatA